MRVIYTYESENARGMLSHKPDLYAKHGLSRRKFKLESDAECYEARNIGDFFTGCLSSP